MGYRRIVTYILQSESGISLKASGWLLDADGVGGGTWDTPSRPREAIEGQLTLWGEQIKYSQEKKQRWIKELGGNE